MSWKVTGWLIDYAFDRLGAVWRDADIVTLFRVKRI